MLMTTTSLELWTLAHSKVLSWRFDLKWTNGKRDFEVSNFESQAFYRTKGFCHESSWDERYEFLSKSIIIGDAKKLYCYF